MSGCCYGGGYAGGFTGGFAGGLAGRSNCICDFPTLIILILIVLQFSKKHKGYHHDDDYDCDDKSFCDKGKDDQIGSGLLFIIALFFLSCVGCGRY